MKRYLAASVLAIVLAAACSPQRSRVVNEQQRKDQQRDYRQMIERARNRQASQAAVQDMQEGVRAFQRDFGRLPSNVVELVSRRYVKHIPRLPDGQQFVFDTLHGNVSIAQAPQMPVAGQDSNRPALPMLP